MNRIVLPSDIEIAVASYGGVGTSFVMDYLSRYKKTNSPADSDGFKHLPLPPISANRNVKFVYVYGNPQMAAASLFRRHFHTAQSMKLQRWIDETPTPIPYAMTLQEYASAGVDRFRFERHFRNWYERYLTGIPTLFVRYETIFDNVAALLDFAELPGDSIDGFPKEKQRESRNDAVPAETVKLLDDMYGDFARFLDTLNDVEMRRTGARRVFTMQYLDRPYRKALADQGIYEVKDLLRRHTPGTFAMLKKLKQRTSRSS